MYIYIYIHKYGAFRSHGATPITIIQVTKSGMIILVLKQQTCESHLPWKDSPFWMVHGGGE